MNAALALLLAAALVVGARPAALPAPGAQAFEGVSVRGRGEGPPVAERILDLAFLGDDRLLALTSDAVLLYRRDGLTLKSHGLRTLTGPFAPVRAAAGVLRVAEEEGAFWVATNRLAEAVLFAVDGSRMEETHRTEALPGGARFRPGTNLLEVGGSAYARLAEGEPTLVVSPEGRLGFRRRDGETWTPARTGYAAVALWSGLVAASSPRPPGGEDTLGLLDLRSEARSLGALPVEGTLTALAARLEGAGALVAAAVETEGGSRILLLELGPTEP